MFLIGNLVITGKEILCEVNRKTETNSTLSTLSLGDICIYMLNK